MPMTGKEARKQAARKIADLTRLSDELAAIWKRGMVPAAPLERSLRYLVEARSGQAIPPSESEEVYYDPVVRDRAVLKMLLSLLLNAC